MNKTKTITMLQVNTDLITKMKHIAKTEDVTLISVCEQSFVHTVLEYEARHGAIDTSAPIVLRRGFKAIDPTKKTRRCASETNQIEHINIWPRQIWKSGRSPRFKIPLGDAKNTHLVLDSEVYKKLEKIASVEERTGKQLIIELCDVFGPACLCDAINDEIEGFEVLNGPIKLL